MSLYVPLQMLMVAVLSVMLLNDTLYMGMYDSANFLSLWASHNVHLLTL